MRIRIEGNADERGSDEYNLALGQRRAASAKRYLVDHGIAADRFDLVSYGEERPVCTEHNTRLVGAPNCAPSLRSVAGLPLALVLESRCKDTLPLLHAIVDNTAAR